MSDFKENCNKFDKVCIDIEKGIKKQDLELDKVHKFNKNSSTKKEYKVRFFTKANSLLKMYFMGALSKSKILKRLVYSNLLLGRFEEFRKFWVDYLKNRPIDIIDFHFLRFSYRKRFQEVSHKDEKNLGEFVKAWQRYENVYILFGAVWKYAKLAYLNFYPFLKYIPNNAHILEYGCGIAPITKGLIRYCPYKDLKFTVADIKQINFLYARWRFSQKNYINFVTINPAVLDNLPLNEKYDVILCLAVLEHLPNPFEVVKVLYEHLKAGGANLWLY